MQRTNFPLGINKSLYLFIYTIFTAHSDDTILSEFMSSGRMMSTDATDALLWSKFSSAVVCC